MHKPDPRLERIGGAFEEVALQLDLRVVGVTVTSRQTETRVQFLRERSTMHADDRRCQEFGRNWDGREACLW